MHIWYTHSVMKTLYVIELILAVTIIALFGITVAAVPSLVLVQSASATTDVMTGTLEEEASNTTSTSNTNNTNKSNTIWLEF
jgi:hypothetical protein